ncbi:hypothetical protein [Microbacterium sp. cx-59]|uniref:hypothetical protein n=1 Tax=Microbacterium sp. cx-59 TaxID=2891207 RepID=UPI001E4B7207|nr:hypothetical protein [Microbacterium sp. cx-59]MCC4907506.1 hypothetical protein [Microbacterium sp. cx-59]
MSEVFGTRAGAVLEARIERARMHPAKRVGLGIAALAISVATGGGGGDDVLPGFDLVVTRRDTGTEVLRARVGHLQEADRVLTQTRRDLDMMTVEQFVREWRAID